jgi:tetratricopeptide (TPR) repeat protein
MMIDSNAETQDASFNIGVSLKHAFCPKSDNEQADLHRHFPCPACGKTDEYIASDRGPRRNRGAVIYYRAALKCRCGFLSYMNVAVNDLPSEQKPGTQSARDALNAAESEGLLEDPVVEELLVRSAASAHNQDWQAAHKAVQSAVQLAPGNPAVWFNLGILLATFDEKDRALQAYQKVQSLSDQFPSAWLNMALIYRSQNLWTEAITYFDRFLEKYPAHQQAKEERQHCQEMIEKREAGMDTN